MKSFNINSCLYDKVTVGEVIMMLESVRDGGVDDLVEELSQAKIDAILKRLREKALRQNSGEKMVAVRGDNGKTKNVFKSDIKKG